MADQESNVEQVAIIAWKKDGIPTEKYTLYVVKLDTPASIDLHLYSLKDRLGLWKYEVPYTEDLSVIFVGRDLPDVNYGIESYLKDTVKILKPSFKIGTIESGFNGKELEKIVSVQISKEMFQRLKEIRIEDKYRAAGFTVYGHFEGFSIYRA